MISVVIPTFRRQNRLRDLLGSLERQVSNVPFEVIVVANLPEVGLKKVVESYGPRFRFHETGRIGVNIARNKGRERARGSVILFLDDDTYITNRDFLQKHFNEHEQHPEAVAIGGPYNPKASLSGAESAYHWILHHEALMAKVERDETRTLLAGNVSFKADGLEPRHRFDDRLVFGASEQSLFQKLRHEQNLFLSLDSLAVEHRLSLNLFGIARTAFFQGYGRGLIKESVEATLDRPHWNSTIPFEETLRRAHVAQTRMFRLSVRVYRRFASYGLKLGLADAHLFEVSTSSKKVIYRRPELTPLKMLAAFFGGRWRSRALAALEEQITAFHAAAVAGSQSRN
jgi:glycosyltransferase involved in cell wall biosynthesis